MQLIGNDPDGAAGPPHLRRRTRRRGRRIVLVAVAFLVGTIGLIAAQRWLEGWAWDKSKPEPRIQEASMNVPDVKMPPPKAEPSPSPPPPMEPPARQRVAARAPKLPDKIAFDVRPQGEPDMAWFHDGRRPHLAHGCALRPGASLIRAVLRTEIASDVPGQAIAEVAEDVYDADGEGRLLIPQGTMAVGVYETERLSFQSRRLGFAWTELTLPDGTQIDLDQSDGMDASGAGGVGGEVRTRWGDLIAAAALFSIFNVGQRGAISDDPSLAGELQDSTLRTTGQIGRSVTEQIFQWRPEIKIKAGTQITISPRKTIRVC